MAASGRAVGIAGTVLAVLVAGGCASASSAAPAPVAGQSAVIAVAGEDRPAIRDRGGALMKAAHADVVRGVHTALADGDLAALRELYVGADWAGQARLLGQERVREQLLTGLESAPVNLGEGYVYQARGYEIGFFLAPQDGGPLEWRGIQAVGATTI